ncbi:ABC transporter ATP-binding protein [Sulfurospirillum barnesii]|uniref:ABC-type multidrug transport system, ATPase and permease component n=1 Tax=Sulfurospirillum barnesii (strain ATCC 700032 / DSM 10660 / SES-3) TaxID=760154 RepID=I3XY99_SULBS|nr:ABC transporter ATP-binding protein [Sulfurospirillum barnesii]AFL68923.1 ABC-type multidrug transport system, ATPase and permease component [Sulfurospirillum barnesii SES-3]
MQEEKRGLWAIMAPVQKEIQTAILLSVLGGALLVVDMALLAYVMNIPLHESVLFLGLHVSFWGAFSLLGMIAIGSFWFSKYAFLVSHHGAFKLEEILRKRLIEHLAQIPLGHIVSTGSGALKKVLLDDVKNLHAFVADSTPMIGKSIATPIVSLIALVFIDWRLALASIAVLVIGGAIMGIVMQDSVEHRKNYDASQEQINRSVIEFVQAMGVVRTFDDGSSSFKRYSNALLRYKECLKAWIDETAMSAKFGMMILSPMPTLLVVGGVGSYFIANHSLNFAPFIAALLISTGMADAMMPLMWMSNFIKKSQASANRIQEILSIAPLSYPAQTLIPNDASVVFENVSFGYEKNGHYALQSISFEVPAGGVTALIGPSGAGKSTVAKLIPRFWDVNEGRILVGGVDVRSMDAEVLMEHVSFVFQDTFLFYNTLKANIKMANPQASDDAVIEAAKAAQIHDFIMSLPQGYDTLAGDRGTRLSGGQKQRLTIARAILRNAPIVVLDEATAFADPENEEEIVKALANLTRNKTVIIIAHRLSTIKDVDHIIVFDEGRIKESGKHEALLAEQGLYASLWANYEKAQHWDLRAAKEIA